MTRGACGAQRLSGSVAGRVITHFTNGLDPELLDYNPDIPIESFDLNLGLEADDFGDAPFDQRADLDEFMRLLVQPGQSPRPPADVVDWLARWPLACLR